MEHLQTPGTTANFYAIKKWLVPSLPEYCAEVPRSIRDGAVDDACQAVKAAKHKYQQTGKIQKVDFRTRKDRVQTLFIRNDSIKRQRMRQAADRLRWKIKDLVRELHFKAARFLCDNFQVIYLPVFESQRMASKTKRKLRKKSVRSMLTGSHHLFRQRLLGLAKRRGVTVMDTGEAYTSKTVNWTGEVNYRLGGAKVVKGSDGQRMDRDLNGALGIYLKGLVGYHLTS